MQAITKTVNSSTLQGIVDLPDELCNRQVEITIRLAGNALPSRFAFSDATESAIAEARRISADPTVKSYNSAKALLDDCE